MAGTSFDYSTAGEQESSIPRRLPPIPHPPSSPSSRPLPQIPRTFACKRCRTCITSSSSFLPASAVPPYARSFKGFTGKASLFTTTNNVNLSRPGVQLMATGAHTMQEISCSTCSLYLGWKIIRGHERSERWKEGNSLLELENLFTKLDPFASVLIHPPTSPSSDTESDDSS